MKNSRFYIVLLAVLLGMYSCNSVTEPFKAKQASVVNDSVKKMMVSISNDVTMKGPIAWAYYFEDVPDFFMANDGKLQLSSGDSAQYFIKNVLVLNISKIELQWSNIRIDTYTATLASVAANFKEYMIDVNGKMLSVAGYFTGVAQKTNSGWRLRNAHWSSAK